MNASPKRVPHVQRLTCAAKNEACGGDFLTDLRVHKRILAQDLQKQMQSQGDLGFCARFEYEAHQSGHED